MPTRRRKRKRATSARPLPLVRWNQLSNFIRILLHTGHVANGRPQSTILISDPGHGKTELLHRFDTNEQATYWSDVTYRTIIDILKVAPRHGTTHLVVTELQKVLNRRSQIAESTLTLLSQAMEEGVSRIGYGPRSHDLKGQRIGLIAATTSTSVARKPFMITELQLDSRAYFVEARGTDEELHEIRRRIVEGDASALTKLYVTVPDSPVKVDVPPAMGHRLDKWVDDMHAKHLDVYGIRTLTRFLHTVRGVALMHGRDVVKPADVDELYTFRNLWMSPPDLSRTGEDDNGTGRD